SRLVGSDIDPCYWALSPGAVIMDEQGIRETVGMMWEHLFTRPGDTNFFAVKCNPNIHILKLMLELGFGLDCASPTELYLAKMAGATPDRIMYTANNIQARYLEYSLHLGCIINLDDITGLDVLEMALEKTSLPMPEIICFRYNPGNRRQDGGTNFIIGNPVDQKYGLTYEQIFPAYRRALELGAKKFGIHTMYASNCLDHRILAGNVAMQLRMVEEIGDCLGRPFDFVNAGGGIGVNYRPGEQSVDLVELGRLIREVRLEFENKNGYLPKLWLESGRFVVAPHGALVGHVINVLDKHKRFIGVDFCDAADLHRANIYESAYHEVNILNPEGNPRSDKEMEVDIVGPLCENVRLAKARMIPQTCPGDIIVVEDAGGHGQAMKMNYNGWGGSKTLLLRPDNSVVQIARAETIGDLFATQTMPWEKLEARTY
ncbi:MAG: hypothetical protein ACOYS2_02075, partial [Patescibacteria group bacterium]